MLIPSRESSGKDPVRKSARVDARHRPVFLYHEVLRDERLTAEVWQHENPPGRPPETLPGT
jgi:hypothetical protein